MLGGWYIVATIPNFLERGMVEGYDVFSAGTQGQIQEDFFMRSGGFDRERKHYVVDIKILADGSNADWRVHPIWPFSLPFQIYYVDPQYQFVLFGEQNRKWGWIYSRTQTLSDADYQSLLARFSALGYDKSLFRRLVQTPEQIGKAGFWSDGIN
jgi:apolipoprotein D and lipocalin family protein